MRGAVVRCGALALVIALCSALPSLPAVADETGTSGPPATTTAPDTTPTTESPPPSAAPTPASTDPPPAAPAEPPPPGAAPQELPDLRATATFDRESYIGSDRVTVTLTITNAGTVDAPGVRAFPWGDMTVETGWQGLDTAVGVLVEAKATRVFTLSGYLWNYVVDSVSFEGNVSSGPGDADDKDNQFSARARLTPASGTFAGVIFADDDADRVMDPGETGLPDTTISLSGPGVGPGLQVVTDAAGRFAFPDLPPGRYQIYYSMLLPYVVSGLHNADWDYVVVAPHDPELRIPAVLNLRLFLRVNMFFEQDSYRPDEQARLTVVLTNQSTTDAKGIVADCPAVSGSAGLPVGPGWGALRSGGVDVPAAHSKIITVSEPVPREAARFGLLTANCAFGPAGYPFTATAPARATARVPGLPGAGRAQLVHDANGDFNPEPGEEVAGVPVVLTDPYTGAEVARATTDAEGYLAVTDLPAQIYDVRIDGPWVPIVEFGFRLPVVADQKGPDPQRWFVEPGAAERNLRSNIRVSASFEKPAYTADERMRIRLSITNIGTAAAENVTYYGIHSGPDLVLDNVGELESNGPGARIEAGATRVFWIEAYLMVPWEAVVITGMLVVAGNDPDRESNADNNEAQAFTRVSALRGTYNGVLYGDANGNREMDPGEALTGVPVDIDGGVPNGHFVQTTDGAGRFTFRDIPAGRYTAFYLLPDSWVVENTEVVVTAENLVDDQVRAVRPGAVLQATIAFTKDSYAVGDVAHLTIRLTNPLPTDLTEVRAICAAWSEIDIYPSEEGWGEIGHDGNGVTVPAGSTATFDVWTVIPDAGFRFGYVRTSCVFGASPHTSPVASATAKVPGGVGQPGGMLIQDRPDGQGQGVADTKVVLTEPGTGRPVARAVTDASGHFKFGDVPAGEYEVVVVGPWKITNCVCPGSFAGSDTDDYEVHVVPGAVQPDPDAPPEDPPGEPVPETPPAPQAAVVSATRLATTGTGLLGQVIGGLALLVVGAGLRLVRRRRTPVG
jgi:hypothetical protein